MATNTGKKLNEQWGVGARHALYRKDGSWWHTLKDFPGALLDEHGYVKFDTKEEYENYSGLSVRYEKNWTGISIQGVKKGRLRDLQGYRIVEPPLPTDKAAPLSLGRIARDIQATDADTTPFDPHNTLDARQKVHRAIKERRGQKLFRDRLIAAYGGRCSITGCDVLSVLEAAHIAPYRGSHTNRVANGLLLRADLHTLLDCKLLVIEPEVHTVILAPEIRNSADYKYLHGRRLRDPARLSDAPSDKAMQQCADNCGWYRSG